MVFTDIDSTTDPFDPFVGHFTNDRQGRKLINQL